jgi:hypothetical protein
MILVLNMKTLLVKFPATLVITLGCKLAIRSIELSASIPTRPDLDCFAGTGTEEIRTA